MSDHAKVCLVCSQDNWAEAPTCQYCGEASWPETPAPPAPPADEEA